MTISIPLPNPLSTSETVLVGLLLLFWALWGWRHGLDAAIIWGLFVIGAAWAAPELAPFLGKVINGIIGFVPLMTSGQFSLDNLSAMVNGQFPTIAPAVDVQNPASSSMQLMTLALFGMITYIGFRYALKQAGGKDPIIASIFGALGAMVVGYIIIRFVLDRVFTFPQTVEIAQSEIPPISVNATLLLAMVLVLVVYGVLRSSKPPAKKG
jgi:hypothetical protein